jgi:uncharacterized protein (UPF0147 family)
MLAGEQISILLEEILGDKGVPRNIKNSIDESLSIMNGTSSNEEKVASVISILDDASSDPNLSMHTRTHIWSVVSALEGLQHGQ